MSDAVTSQTIVDGQRNLVMRFTNISDGTGESAVTKVDVSALTPAANSVNITKIHYTTKGMSVQIYWDATTDVFVIEIPADHEGFLDFTKFGGLTNTKATGYTGDVLFTTVGHSANDTYTIVMEMKKKLTDD